MAAYRRVYDSRHLQADCQEPESCSSGTLRSVIEYGLPLPFLAAFNVFTIAMFVSQSGLLRTDPGLVRGHCVSGLSVCRATSLSSTSVLLYLLTFLSSCLFTG